MTGQFTQKKKLTSMISLLVKGFIKNPVQKVTPYHTYSLKITFCSKKHLATKLLFCKTDEDIHQRVTFIL